LLVEFANLQDASNSNHKDIVGLEHTMLPEVTAIEKHLFLQIFSSKPHCTLQRDKFEDTIANHGSIKSRDPSPQEMNAWLSEMNYWSEDALKLLPKAMIKSLKALAEQPTLAEHISRANNDSLESVTAMTALTSTSVAAVTSSSLPVAAVEKPENVQYVNMLVPFLALN
jgi:hypothetical protein